jgi:hypothetical protein
MPRRMRRGSLARPMINKSATRAVFGCLVLVMAVCAWTVGRAAEAGRRERPFPSPPSLHSGPGADRSPRRARPRRARFAPAHAMAQGRVASRHRLTVHADLLAQAPGDARLRFREVHALGADPARPTDDSSLRIVPLMPAIILFGDVDVDVEGARPRDRSRLSTALSGSGARSQRFHRPARRCAPTGAPEERRWSPSHLDLPAG